MGMREFAHWRAFCSLYPVGDEAADIRNAMACALLANCHRDPGARAFQASDFMPVYGEVKKRKSLTEELAIWRGFAAVQNNITSKDKKPSPRKSDNSSSR